MLQRPHPLDPNFIDFGQGHEHYIYATVPPSLQHLSCELNNDGFVEVRVDAEDYWFFSKWTWQIKFDKRGKKPYAYRKVWCTETRTKNQSLFLHVAIQDRAEPKRPVGHTIVDHKNGDTLECRKANLEYVTPSQNCKNRKVPSQRVNGKFARRPIVG